jgi:hypothetical protein
MAKRPQKAVYFTTVVAVEEDAAIVAGHLYMEGTEPTVTRIFVCDGGKWGHLGDFEEVVYAAARKPPPKGASVPTYCIVGRRGAYREWETKKPPVDQRVDTKDGGYLMDLRYIDGSLYTCGGQNQVHVQGGKSWQRMDPGLFVPLDLDKPSSHVSIHSMDGFSANDIYAAGYAGALRHWNGKKWTPLDTPTNQHFNVVLCSKGEVYLGGEGGLVFKGDRKKGWKDLGAREVNEEPIEDMTEFQGKIYMAAEDVLLSTDGTKVEEVKIPVKGKEMGFYAVDSNERFLWSVGHEWVLQFDGKKWTRHECPDNK